MAIRIKTNIVSFVRFQEKGWNYQPEEKTNSGRKQERTREEGKEI